MTSPPTRVTWLCLPWQAVSRANLGLALVSAMVRDVTESTTVFANIRFTRLIGESLYERLQATRFSGEALFTPTAFQLDGAGLEDWLRSAVPVMRDEAGLDAAQVERLVLTDVPAFVEGLVGELVQWGSALVGMSLLASQVVPSLAVARALKRVAPDVKILVGGSASFGSMGASLLESFAEFDVAVTGEVSRWIVELVEHMVLGTSPAGIPGIAYRDQAGRVRRAPASGPDHLDALPVPDYADYIAQHHAAGLDRELWLPFEASRGCWWGEHTICSFCGLNGENVWYRRKRPAKVTEELRVLHERYGVSQFCATDNILPANAGQDLLPALAELRRSIPGLRIYYQMKSNVSRRLLTSLVDAGVTVVQPGIESFNDNILKLMRKGATGLTQVRALKLMTEADVEAIYGILHGTVGETADDLREQATLIPALHHLIPPSYYSPISLDRFSPYAEAPAEYGLELSPPEHSELLFPDVRVDRLGIAGWFGVRRATPATSDYQASVAELGDAVARWQESYRAGRTCTYTALPGPVVHVTDRRAADEQRFRLDGARAAVLLGADLASALRGVARRQKLDWPDVQAAADWLDERQLIVRRGDLAISLPTRQSRVGVIGLTGLPCAGKSFFAAAAREMGVPCLDVGAIIRSKFGDEAYDLSPAEKIDLLGKEESVFRGLGPELREACPADGLLLVDSFKAAADLEVVRDELPEAMVESLLITADPGVRRTRFVTRARPDDGPSLEAKEGKLEVIGIQWAVREATWTLTNDGTPEAFRREIEEFLGAIRSCLGWVDR